MSDSARRLLELLDELEPVLLPGWQVADPSDLLHGLTTAQFKAVRSQLDRQQAAALAAAAEAQKANVRVTAAQASVAELGKTLAQLCKVGRCPSAGRLRHLDAIWRMLCESVYL